MRTRQKQGLSRLPAALHTQTAGACNCACHKDSNEGLRVNHVVACCAPSSDPPEKAGIYVRNPDGSITPATPLGWQEEHGLFARFIFWLRRKPHCCDAEMKP